MRTCSWSILVVALLVVALSTPSLADKRAYVWTYEYQTMPRGGVELEGYSTFSTPDAGTFENITSVEHQLEVEVGMTDRYDFAIYQVFRQEPESALTYDGFKLRARYRFGEKGLYFLDPLVYAEFKDTPDFSEPVVELKLILAKDSGRFNVSLNPILEVGDEDGNWEADPEYAVGMSLGVVGELLRVGVEAKGGEHGHYVGPVISHGGSPAFVALGSAIKVSDIDAGEPEVEVRLLVGVGVSRGHGQRHSEPRE